ncbi:MAG: biopolymer transporter ExbD [Orrella sp.]
MHLRAKDTDDSPDINFIPLIDVLLVIVIFLAVSTTFTQERALDVLLPQAQSDVELPQAINLTISADGQVAVDQRVLESAELDSLVAAIARIGDASSERIVVIRADANASHQAVVTAMQAARLAGIEKISLAAQVSD